MSWINPHYCTPEQVLSLARYNNITSDNLPEFWADWVDAEIEQWMGMTYKAAARQNVVLGLGTTLLKLNSKAASITSITEDNGGAVRTLVDSVDYRLELNGRMVERLNNITFNSSFVIYPWYGRTALWLKSCRYVVSYVEPGMGSIPMVWQLGAASALSIMAMFSEKYHEFGLALTASDAGSAGKVSTASSTSFPPDLVRSVRDTIQEAIRKPFI